ncbi:MAG: hypothetical protein PHW04_08655 [Candidatus Wallbacteria bacterium]|nr:hypothetical protein [Candidatus Wallbacteria bacterium]
MELLGIINFGIVCLFFLGGNYLLYLLTKSFWQNRNEEDNRRFIDKFMFQRLSIYKVNIYILILISLFAVLRLFFVEPVSTGNLFSVTPYKYNPDTFNVMLNIITLIIYYVLVNWVLIINFTYAVYNCVNRKEWKKILKFSYMSFIFYAVFGTTFISLDCSLLSNNLTFRSYFTEYNYLVFILIIITEASFMTFPFCFFLNALWYNTKHIKTEQARDLKLAIGLPAILWYFPSYASFIGYIMTYIFNIDFRFKM